MDIPLFLELEHEIGMNLLAEEKGMVEISDISSSKMLTRDCWRVVDKVTESDAIRASVARNRFILCIHA